MTRPVFDTHCHLQDRAFAADAEDVIARAQAAGIRGIVVLGYDAPSNIAALSLARPGVFPAVGYHPHDAKELNPAALDELARQADSPEVVAIGEIGLDFYRDLSPHDAQREALDAQLALAISTGKPVCVHSRAAEAEIRPHLAAYAGRSPLPGRGRPAGVMHCFAGTLEQARDYVELGFLVSVACTVTYPSNGEGRRIAADLPLDSLVVETDSPYLPPQPLRGKRNEPANVRTAVEAIAAVRGLDPVLVAGATTRNAERLFGVTIDAQVPA